MAALPCCKLALAPTVCTNVATDNDECDDGDAYDDDETMAMLLAMTMMLMCMGMA